MSTDAAPEGGHGALVPARVAAQGQVIGLVLRLVTERFRLDRHWRNARTRPLDPVAFLIRSGLTRVAFFACGPWSVPRAKMGSEWYYFPMEAVVDQAGRIVLPKSIRDALGLLPGTKVDISPYGAGVQVVPAGRTARLVEEDGVLVSAGDTPVDDDILFGLIDAGRK
jgi:AbrB family looped-hinge helix DNA binding protein